MSANDDRERRAREAVHALPGWMMSQCPPPRAGVHSAVCDRLTAAILAFADEEVRQMQDAAGLLSPEAMARVVDLVENPRPPTEAMRALFAEKKAP